MQQLIKLATIVYCTMLVVNSPQAIANAGCSGQVSFLTKAKTRNQTLELAEGVTLELKQSLANITSKEAKISSNVICQKLTGASYTGSKEEWQNFIDSSNKALVQKKFKNITITMVGEDDSVYQGKLDNKEYIYTAKTPNGPEQIYNLAVLDKANNTMYTFSVSGHEQAGTAIFDEYKRLVNSFKLN